MIFLCTRYKRGDFHSIWGHPESAEAKAERDVAVWRGLGYEVKLITAPNLLEAVNSEPEWFSAEPRKADDAAA